MKKHQFFKRTLACALVIVMALTAVPMSGFVGMNLTSLFRLEVSGMNLNFSGGSGTEDDPYLIETKEQLDNIRNHLDANFMMISDIEFTDDDFEEGGDYYNNGEKWLPLGAGYVALEIQNENDFNDSMDKYKTLYYKNSKNYYYSIYSYDDFYSTYYYFETFTGNFDGNGHVIKNLQINNTKRKYSGLFGSVKGTVTNLGVTDCNVNIKNDTDYMYYGTICASGEIISNCYVTGDITITTSNKSSGDGRIGGIAGFAEKISECCNYASITVTGNAYLGGIVGLSSSNNSAYIQDCYNVGNIVSTDSDTWSAGLIGLWQGGLVKNSYNIGKSTFPIFGRKISGDSDRLRNLYFLRTECTYADTNLYESTLKKRFNEFSKSYIEMADPITYQGFDMDNIWTYGNTDYPFPLLKSIGLISVDVSDKNPCRQDHKYINSEYVKIDTHKATTIENGAILASCTICKKHIKTTTIYKASSIKLSKKSYTYNGKVQKPTVTVKNSKGEVLKNGTDYTVSYASGCKNTGKYAVKITFKGNYSGTKTLYFNILPSKTSKLTASQTTTSIKATWKAVTGATGYKVTLYTSKGKAVKTVYTTKTTASFTKLSKGTTYKVRVTAYKTIGGKKVASSVYTQINTATKPGTPSLKVKAGAKKASLSWNKQTGSSGYVVYMATSKNGTYKKIATVKGGTKVSYTKTGLTKGKTYYFKVRAYVTPNSKTTVYGDYSSVKYAKIK